MPHIRRLITERDDRKCIYCGTPTNGIDHVIPISEGGLTIPANGVCCCKSCNSKKYNKLDERWIVKGLQRLIQHGEDISWIGSLRHGEEPIEYRAIPILLDAGFNIFEVIELTGLSYQEVTQYVNQSSGNCLTE